MSTNVSNKYINVEENKKYYESIIRIIKVIEYHANKSHIYRLNT